MKKKSSFLKNLFRATSLVTSVLAIGAGAGMLALGAGSAALAWTKIGYGALTLAATETLLGPHTNKSEPSLAPA
ncbi:MAG: hypothetical protein FWE38_00500 [Firmicutes bacterium]|nr:hypothetical protein [Bacillota bacterium]